VVSQLTDKEAYLNLAERIRTVRKDRQLSQEDLAHRAGLSLRAYRSLERGEAVDPHYSSLSGIAAGLGMSVGELIEEPALAPKA
jgi:transcriptional regulator with XRE-family HTH domain